MNYKDYISSGIIEDYCLGLLTDDENKSVEQEAQLHPEIRLEIDSVMQALEQYAFDNSFNPGEQVKKKTLALIDNLIIEKEANIDNLPLLNKFSDHSTWLRVVEPVLPSTLDKGIFVSELRKNSSDISQLVIWSAIDYPDEVHEDVQECFIILRGRCRCQIEDSVVELGPGGFLEIPMFKHHDVKVLEPVLAVVQRIKVA